MKKLLSLFAVFTMTVSCMTAQDLNLTTEALEYKLTATDNKGTNLREIIKKHNGKTIVIEFWASWCSDCVKNMPNVKKLQANNPEVDFVFVSFDKTKEAWAEGIKKHELNGEQFFVGETMKGDFGRSIDLDWIPRYIIIDKYGKVALYKATEKENERVEELLKRVVRI